MRYFLDAICPHQMAMSRRNRWPDVAALGYSGTSVGGAKARRESGMRVRIAVTACALWLLLGNLASAQEWFFASPRVVDGDTLAFPSTDAGAITAHLDGIDAVEDKQRCAAG